MESGVNIAMIYVNMVLSLLAGLGAFMIGFKLMSDGMKSFSDGGLKKLFLKTGKSPLAGVGVGLVTTALVQSSSVTTVMVVGFVNAGIMGLEQAASVIMGANIGSTITAQIAALETLNIGNFDFIAYAAALSAVGIFINLFAKKDKTKIIGTIIAGFGLLFLGMRLMSDAMAILRTSDKIVAILSKINNPLLLLLIGAVITGIIQSSAAVTAILISMAAAGITIGSGGNSVYFVILGTNIGTCITAIMSSFGASPNAKRASFIHLTFNVAGSLLFTALLWGWKGFSSVVMDGMFPREDMMATKIAMFHTLFNVICTAMFLPLRKVFVSVSKKVFGDKKEEKVSALEERLLSSPAIAVGQALAETKRAADLAFGNVLTAMNAFYGKDETKANDIKDANKKLVELTSEIDDYLVKISAGDAGNGTAVETEVAALHHVLIDVGRIGELADNISKYTAFAKANDLVFSENVLIDLRGMTSELERLYNLCSEYISLRDDNVLKTLDVTEDGIDERKRTLLDDHVKRLQSGVCNGNSSSTFVNLVSNLERIGDHIYLIAHALK